MGSEDLIKRIDALVAIRNLYPAKPKIDFMDTISNWRQKNRQYMECERAIEELPTAQPSPENCWGCNCPKMVPSATQTNAPNVLNALDCVSRKAAIETAQRMYERCDTGDIIDYRDMVVESLKVLPTADIDLSDYSDRLWRNAYEQGKADAEPRWIPVTERLPEIDMTFPHSERYLVQYEDGDMDVASWSNVNRFWTDHVTEPHWNCVQFQTVTAWMPLPEPWKGGTE